MRLDNRVNLQVLFSYSAEIGQYIEQHTISIFAVEYLVGSSRNACGHGGRVTSAAQDTVVEHAGAVFRQRLDEQIVIFIH